MMHQPKRLQTKFEEEQNAPRSKMPRVELVSTYDVLLVSTHTIM